MTRIRPAAPNPSARSREEERAEWRGFGRRLQTLAHGPEKRNGRGSRWMVAGSSAATVGWLGEDGAALEPGANGPRRCCFQGFRVENARCRGRIRGVCFSRPTEDFAVLSSQVLGCGLLPGPWGLTEAIDVHPRRECRSLSQQPMRLFGHH
jgi:hypothetical protein